MTRLFTSLMLLAICVVRVLAQEVTVINEQSLHLGREGRAEWDEFAVSPPDGLELELVFESEVNDAEVTLLIQQDDVRHNWRVLINGTFVGNLVLMEADLVSSFAVPAGVLRDGRNVLKLMPPESIDDIRIGRVVLVRKPKREDPERGPDRCPCVQC